jgi:hypothetical protein
VTDCILAAVVDPFINAGVDQVVPSDDVAKRGRLLDVSRPTATNKPDELTVTDCMSKLFTLEGVEKDVHVDPLEEVENVNPAVGEVR